MIDPERLKRSNRDARAPHIATAGDLGASRGVETLASQGELTHDHRSGTGNWGMPVSIWIIVWQAEATAHGDFGAVWERQRISLRRRYAARNRVQAAGVTDAMIRTAEALFDEALRAAGVAAHSFRKVMTEFAVLEAEMELGFQFTGKGTIYIVQSEAQAATKVKLKFPAGPYSRRNTMSCHGGTPVVRW